MERRCLSVEPHSLLVLTQSVVDGAQILQNHRQSVRFRCDQRKRLLVTLGRLGEQPHLRETQTHVIQQLP